MSLINQALKKAQRERVQPSQTEESPKDYMAARPGNPAQSPHFQIVKYVVGALLLIAGMGTAITFMVFLIKKEPAPVAQEPPVTEVEVTYQTKPAPRPDPEPVPQQTQPIAQTIVPEPAPGLPAPAQQQQSNIAPNPVAAQPPPTNTISKPANVAPPTPATAEPVAVAQPAKQPAASPAATVTPPPSTTEQPAATSEKPALVIPDNPKDLIPEPVSQPVSVASKKPAKPKAEKAVKPAKAAEPNPYVIAFLEASRITGVRIAGSQSKVLMNNRVFRKNAIVEPKTKLRITKILKNEIQFVDESGLRYTKQF